METQKWHFKLCLLIVCSAFSPVVSINSTTIPSHGCYWNMTCQDKWWGECGMGHSIFGRSNDCNGVCQEPKYSFCPPPLFTRFYCCILESPKVTIDWCTKCDNKVDKGDEYLCCTDCSYPQLVSDDPKLGYCKTGAQLLFEPIPKDVSRVFKWVAGPWKPCSLICDDGSRSCDVECYAVFEDTLVPDHPVYDHQCSKEEMPTTEEPCNLRACLELDEGSSEGRNPSWMPAWAVAAVSFLGFVVVGGIGFAGFIQYKSGAETMARSAQKNFVQAEMHSLKETIDTFLLNFRSFCLNLQENLNTVRSCVCYDGRISVEFYILSMML